MKNAFIMILALASVSAFAGEHKDSKKAARKEAITACKSEGKSTKADIKACVKEKLNPGAQATK